MAVNANETDMQAMLVSYLSNSNHDVPVTFSRNVISSPFGAMALYSAWCIGCADGMSIELVPIDMLGLGPGRMT